MPKHHVIGCEGGVKKKLCTFLTLVLHGVSGQHYIPAALPPMERNPGTHCIKRLDGPQSQFGHIGGERISALAEN